MKFKFKFDENYLQPRSLKAALNLTDCESLPFSFFVRVSEVLRDRWQGFDISYNLVWWEPPRLGTQDISSQQNSFPKIVEFG